MTISSSPARPRADPNAALEIEGHEEEDTEYHQVGQEPAHYPSAEVRPVKKVDIEHRIRTPTLTEDEGHDQTRSADEESDNRRRTPTAGVAERDGYEQGYDGREEESEPRPVEWCRVLEVATPGDQQDPGDHAEETERHVHEEDEPPPSGGEEEAAHGWAERQSDGLGGALDPDRSAQQRLRDSEDDDGDAVGLEESSADGLEHTEADEPSEIRREPTQRGTDDEDAESVDIEELATPHVGEAADGHHGGNEDEEVAQSHPGHRVDPGMEGALESRERNGHDAGVELAHEGTDAHGSDGEPKGPRSVPDPIRALRLDHQPLPSGRGCGSDGDVLHGSNLAHANQEVE